MFGGTAIRAGVRQISGGAGRVFSIAVENGFDFLSKEYAALFAASEASAFQHPAFLAGIYGKLMEPNGAAPLIVVARTEADGLPAMVLPLVRRRLAGLRVIEFADLGVTDYASPVAGAQTFRRILADAGATERIGRVLRPYDLLRIGKLQPDAVALERLFGLERREAMGTNCYAAPLAATYEEWRAQRLDRSYARELDKKTRQLNRRGRVDFARVVEPDAVRRTFEAMRAYRHARYAGESHGDLMRRDAYYDFYLGVALAAAGEGFGRTYALRVDGEPIACAFALVRDGRVLVILNGFDEAGYKRQSVGSLMFQEIARDCIASGDGTLDFTIGDEPYKLTFGGEPRPMSRFSRAGSLRGRAASFAVERSPLVRELARRVLRRG